MYRTIELYSKIYFIYSNESFLLLHSFKMAPLNRNHILTIIIKELIFLKW